MRVRAGIDLVEVEEVRHALAANGQAYLHRVYTAREIADCRRGTRLAPGRLAERFAAKEATFKALGIREQAVSWHDVEVRHNFGAPLLLLHGNADTLAREGGLVSLSLGLFRQRRGLAGALVIAESN